MWRDDGRLKGVIVQLFQVIAERVRLSDLFRLSGCFAAQDHFDRVGHDIIVVLALVFALRQAAFEQVIFIHISSLPLPW